MNKYKIVTVVFDEFSNNPYAYYTDIENLTKDDLVVVQVKNKQKSPLGFDIAKVYQVEGLMVNEIKRAEKWIVCRVNMDEFNKRMERERCAQEIRNKLRARKEEAEEFLIYEALAKKDPEIQNLLERLSKYDDSVPKLKLK